MATEHLRIGELARRSGVTVRALHHYDAIGLLRPAAGGRGEHRLYGPAEVERLTRIVALSGLGLSLDEIRRALDDPGSSLPALCERHLARLDEDLARAGRVRDRLTAVARSLAAADEPSIELLLETLKVTTAMEDVWKHYTPEQREYLERRGEEIGPERIAAVQREWRELFAALGAAQARGAAPDDPEVLALARRSNELVLEFTGGHPGVRESLARMYAADPDLPQSYGVEPDAWRFLGAARRALGDADAAD